MPISGFAVLAGASVHPKTTAYFSVAIKMLPVTHNLKQQLAMIFLKGSVPRVLHSKVCKMKFVLLTRAVFLKGFKYRISTWCVCDRQRIMINGYEWLFFAFKNLYSDSCTIDNGASFMRSE